MSKCKEMEKRKKKHRKEKKKRRDNDKYDGHLNREKKKIKIESNDNILPTGKESKQPSFPFEYRYILAPMVGASELAFRLLCRKYGAQLCYTPMMIASKFATDESYRKDEFQTIPQDRPLVCHFCANDPREFALASQLAEPFCDAIDLNLGCPQRTAYVGHYGSYLLNPQDRSLILDMVRAATKAVKIPIFCKIRLLDTLQDTIQLCLQLREAGASLIAIHARYRASYERNGPGARDGPALLDQVLEVKKCLPDFPIIANGNIISYDDVCNNLKYTRADGVMSAEGILDNPALYLPRYQEDKTVEEIIPVHTIVHTHSSTNAWNQEDEKCKRKLAKKLREIETLEQKQLQTNDLPLSIEQTQKISKKGDIQNEMSRLISKYKTEINFTTQQVSWNELEKNSQDKLKLATEYLSLVQLFPVKLRSIIFHIRRMLKKELTQYQLMEECIGSASLNEIHVLVQKLIQYRDHPTEFCFDLEKAKREKEALERKRREEGKRKEYEARMIRKAKREGKEDLEFYLRQGARVPTWNEVTELKRLPREQQLLLWKERDHSQHCMAYHLNEGGCQRDRACCFLHLDSQKDTAFDEIDEVAG